MPAIPETLPSWIVLAALAVAALSLVLSITAVVRRRRSGRRGVAGSASVDPTTLDELDALAAAVSGLRDRLDAADAGSARMIQRVGVVRFNPFPDTGGNQSFVVALLDARGDGVVLSSLHSRGGTRVYLKQLTAGKAETALSEEESEAIRSARAG